MKIPAPGVYRLVNDVANTKRDRRQTRDWRHNEVWSAGTLFVLEAPRTNDQMPRLFPIEENGYSGFVLDLTDKDGGHPNLPELLAGLVPAPLTIRTLFSDSNGDPSPDRALEILQRLVDDRSIAFSDIRRAWATIREDDELKHEEWTAKNDIRTTARKQVRPLFFCLKVHPMKFGQWTCSRVKDHAGKCHSNGIGDKPDATKAAWAKVKAAEDAAIKAANDGTKVLLECIRGCGHPLDEHEDDGTCPQECANPACPTGGLGRPSVRS